MTNQAPTFEITEAAGRSVLTVAGDWTVTSVGDVDEALRDLGRPPEPLQLDVTALGRLDTAGAFILDRTLRDSCETGAPAIEILGAHPAAQRLIAQVRAVAEGCEPPIEPSGSLVSLLERAGRGSQTIWNELLASLSFLGEALATSFRLLLQPHRIRWTPTVAVMEEAGLDALPIIAFLSFFVGMVVAFIGATILRDFGASIFTVELVGFSMLREFGVVLTAIILAGRTNSSFTAQIGAMRMRQEVDAMQTLGLSPMEVLVAPRIFAMVLMTPVLAFISTLSGIAGGLVVGALTLDISPAAFLSRLQEYVPLQHFWVGMSKAPVFGLVLAIIACRQGLMVGGSVQSLGQRTTTSVVQAIFAVIVLDAIFAVFYMELDI